VSILDRIVAAIDGQDDQNLLCFGNYRIAMRLGRGQQGLVLQVKSQLDQLFALKLYFPTDTDPHILAAGISTFQREVQTLVALQHRHIVKAFSGGVAVWSPTSKAWTVLEGFPATTDTAGDTVHYYLMDYVQRGSEDLFPALKTPAPPADTAPESEPYRRAELFERMASQIGEALRYLHKQGLAHKDVKPQNIRFYPSDSSFVLTDFGFARHFTSAQDTEVIKRTELEDLVSIQAGKYEKNDLAQLSLILKRILPGLSGVYDKVHYNGISHALDKALVLDLEQRFADAAEFLVALEPFFEASTSRRWRLTVRTSECLTSSLFGRFDSRLRIPVSGSIHLSREVRSLIDDSAFQRLRGVRQLGPTSFVYPGATHTRFEHSLGTYWLALRYLESLSLDLTFRHVCSPLDETIKLGVVAALLHDVGHYPYSHWIEEIDSYPSGIQFPSHEERAKTLIANSSLGKTLEGLWGINLEELASVIMGTPTSVRGQVITSLINSPIDVDKLDYLARDSTHCGVPYGAGFEIDRVVDSLCVDPMFSRIALTQKGRSVPLAVVTSRNLMYREVYWHKTVRACDAMFKRFFYELVRARAGKVHTISKWLELPDDLFLLNVYTATSEQAALQALIAPFAGHGRVLYKPAYVFSRNARGEPPSVETFFEKVLYKWGYGELVAAGERLAKSLSTTGCQVEPLDVLIDKVPVKHGERYEVEKLQLFDTRRGLWEPVPKEVGEQNDYLGSTQQAYVFCHPRLYERLKALSPKDWDGIFKGL
jgi:hypothetical protein